MQHTRTKISGRDIQNTRDRNLGQHVHHIRAKRAELPTLNIPSVASQRNVGSIVTHEGRETIAQTKTLATELPAQSAKYYKRLLIR